MDPAADVAGRRPAASPAPGPADRVGDDARRPRAGSRRRARRAGRGTAAAGGDRTLPRRARGPRRGPPSSVGVAIVRPPSAAGDRHALVEAERPRTRPRRQLQRTRSRAELTSVLRDAPRSGAHRACRRGAAGAQRDGPARGLGARDAQRQAAVAAAGHGDAADGLVPAQHQAVAASIAHDPPRSPPPEVASAAGESTRRRSSSVAASARTVRPTLRGSPP